MNNIDETINRLKKYDDFDEVYHKISFQCLRTKNGKNQTVDVDIFDAGPDVHQPARYYCVATLEDGKKAYGNPASTMKQAASIVHWDELDR